MSKFHLEAEPFPVTGNDNYFYAPPALTQWLYVVHRRLEASDQLLVVEAAAGAGKTTVLRQITAGMPRSWRVVEVSGTDGPDQSRFVAALASGLGVETAATGLADHIAALKERLRLRAEEGVATLFVVDDAHALPTMSLELVARLWEQARRTGARFLLSGEPGVLRRLRALAGAADLAAGGVALPALSESQVDDYIHLRLYRAGLSGDTPFAEKVVRRIWKTSGGLPGRVDTLAREVVRDHKARRRPRRLPGIARSRRGYALASSAAGALALGASWWQGEPASAPAPVPTAQVSEADGPAPVFESSIKPLV